MSKDRTHSLTAYPLSWPEGWKRSRERTRAAFGKAGAVSGNSRMGMSRLSVADAVGRLLRELDRMGIGEEDVLISTNVQLRIDGLPRSDREPADPGAAVYWQVDGKSRTMAIDKYDRVADNLAAIAATLEAMRAIERYGGAAILDRAFLGFAALPQRASKPWREVLGIEGEATLELVESRFRALVKVHHPDLGGKRDDFEKLQQAREAAQIELAS
jgi:hypothetical protein